MSTTAISDRKTDDLRLLGSKPLIWGIMICLVFFVYNLVPNIVFLAAGVGLMLLSWFLLTNTELLQLLIVLTPSIMMIKPESSSMAIVGYFMLLIAMKIFLTDLENVNITFSLIIIVFSSLITCAIYMDMSILTTLVRNVLFFCLIYHQVKHSPVFHSFATKMQTLRIYCCGVLTNLLLGVLFYIFKGQNLMGGLFSGIRNDRNYFAAILLTAIAISISLIIYSKKHKLKTNFIDYVCIALCIAGGVLSNSRTFFIGLILIILFAIPYLLSPKQIGQTILIIAVVALSAFIFKDLLAEPFKNLLERFTSDDMSTGNGRFDTWLFYLELLVETPIRFFFGNGSAVYYVETNQVQFVEHNSFLELLSTYGLIGFIARFFMYFAIFKQMFTSRIRTKLYLMLPFLATGLVFFAVSAGTSEQFSIALLLSFLTMSLANDNTSQELDLSNDNDNAGQRMIVDEEKHDIVEA